MRKNNLTTGLIAALLVASPVTWAESQYPAADFQPTTIYQDTGYIARHAQSVNTNVTTEQASPNRGYATSHDQAGAGEPAGFGSTETAGGTPAGGVGSILSDNFPIVLIVIGLAGFIFWSGKQPGSGGGKSARQGFIGVPLAPAATDTGVAKYLASLDSTASPVLSGVAKYLKKLDVAAILEAAQAADARAAAASAAANTGVARYLKHLETPVAKSVVETGVARYLKSRG